MWIEGRGWGTGRPGRFVWVSFSAGVLGLLLVGLLVWVDQLDPGDPSSTQSGWVSVQLEPARAELRLPVRDVPVSVPLAAVLRDSALEPYCYVVESKGGWLRVRVRRLVLGPVRGARVLVRSGVAPGEWVVVRGQHRLFEGADLRMEPISPGPARATAATFAR